MTSTMASHDGEPSARITREPDAESLVLGQSMRKLRKQARLTLQEVADSAGVSRSLISQVERGLAQPSLTTLRAIAAVLGVRVSALFYESGSATGTPTSSDERRFVVRAGMRKSLHSNKGGVDFELLSPDDDHERQTEFLRAVYAPGGATPAEEGQYVAHTGEENCFCITGSLTFLLGTTAVEVGAGDSISFDSAIPHRVENRGAEPAVVIIAMTPPGF
jgi:transcriptional regulator with XRE-family HTH domain